MTNAESLRKDTFSETIKLIKISGAVRKKKKHVHIQYAQLTSRARPPMNTRLIISWPSGTVGAWKRQIISEMFYLSFYAVRTRLQVNS